MNGNLGRILGVVATLIIIVGAIVSTSVYVSSVSAVANAAKAQADTNAQVIQTKADKDVVDQIHIDIREIREDLDDLRGQDVFSTKKKRFQRTPSAGD